MRNFLRQLQARLARSRRRPPAPEEVTPEWLIMGLGNPGARYEATKHNVGYMVVDALCDAIGVRFEPGKVGVPARVAIGQVGETAVAVAKATTYMNESGCAARALARQWGLSPSQIIVVHDELDLPPHQIKLRQGGGENGHNGLKSISAELGSRDYLRVRCGIGRPQAGTSIVDWVLGPVDDDERGLGDAITTACRAVELICTDNLAKAQQVIHSRR